MCVDGNLKVSKEQVTCMHSLTFGIETIKNGLDQEREREI